ncbi:hypothetical protein D3C87_1667780 [compost metagenome]
MPSGARLREIAALLDSGRLRPPRIECLPLEHAGRALDLVQSGKAASKLVLRIAEPANAHDLVAGFQSGRPTEK